MVVRDCDRLNLNLRSQLRDRGKYRRPLGTVGHPIRSVFYIATRKDFPVCKKHGGPHTEVRVRRVSMLHHFSSRSFQLFLHGGGQFQSLFWQGRLDDLQTAQFD